MTYSEFGRRAAQNGSGGTDHGKAAPHFVLGGAVHGGLYGMSPRLEALDEGDVPATTDFRSLYNTVLTRWWTPGAAGVAAYRAAALSGRSRWCERLSTAGRRSALSLQWQ